MKSFFEYVQKIREKNSPLLFTTANNALALVIKQFDEHNMLNEPVESISTQFAESFETKQSELTEIEQSSIKSDEPKDPQLGELSVCSQTTESKRNRNQTFYANEILNIGKCNNNCSHLTSYHFSYEYFKSICEYKTRFTYPTLTVLFLKAILQTHNNDCKLYTGAQKLIECLHAYDAVICKIRPTEREIKNSRNLYGSLFSKKLLHSLVVKEFSKNMCGHASYKTLAKFITPVHINYNTSNKLLAMLFTMYSSPDELLNFVNNPDNYINKYCRPVQKNDNTHENPTKRIKLNTANTHENPTKRIKLNTANTHENPTKKIKRNTENKIHTSTKQAAYIVLEEYE